MLFFIDYYRGHYYIYSVTKDYGSNCIYIYIYKRIDWEKCNKKLPVDALLFKIIYNKTTYCFITSIIIGVKNHLIICGLH